MSANWVSCLLLASCLACGTNPSPDQNSNAPLAGVAGVAGSAPGINAAGAGAAGAGGIAINGPTTMSGGVGGSAAGSGGAAGLANGGSGAVADAGGSMAGGQGGTPMDWKLEHVFVLAMENHDQVSIVDNEKDAPYLNTLIQKGARACNFTDELPKDIVSEPHYVWMESGTNVFSDHTFDSDSDASDKNSTADTTHLVTQLGTANISWMSYQEGINDKTGSCPIASDGFYAAKHDPFVFFRDVSGSPPSKTNMFCAEHHRPLSALFDDLKANVARFVFITPNLCHDMHGATGCPESNLIRAGDDWLAANLPPVLDYIAQHRGVLFITWDEGENTLAPPFVALGPTIKPGYLSLSDYTHSSILKTNELIFGLPISPRVADCQAFDDMFTHAPY